MATQRQKRHGDEWLSVRGAHLFGAEDARPGRDEDRPSVSRRGIWWRPELAACRAAGAAPPLLA